MKLLKSTVIATALSASLVAPAIANESSSIAASQFSATDMQQMFEQDAQPMQVAALSRTEMKETEGAFGLAGAIVGAVINGAVYSFDNQSFSWPGFTTSVVMGAVGGAMGGIPGTGVAAAGGVASRYINSWY